MLNYKEVDNGTIRNLNTFILNFKIKYSSNFIDRQKVLMEYSDSKTYYITGYSFDILKCKGRKNFI